MHVFLHSKKWFLSIAPTSQATVHSALRSLLLAASVAASAWLLQYTGVLSLPTQPAVVVAGPATADPPVRPVSWSPGGIAAVRPVFRDSIRAAWDGTPPTQKLKAPDPSVAELSPEELATVNLFLNNSPSVVHIANMAVAQDVLTMDVFKIPQVCAVGR